MRRLGVFIAIAAISACGGGDPHTGPVDPVVVSLGISPDSLLLQVGQPFYLAAVPRNAAGQTIPNLTATWTSSATSIATIEPNGVVTAVGVGEDTVTATIGAFSHTMPLTVIPTIRRTSISPPDASVEKGLTLQLSVILFDSLDNEIDATVFHSWQSSNTVKATVSATGLVTALDTGTVIITGGISTGNAALQYTTTTVTIVPHITITSVEVLPNPVGLIVGQTRTLAAFAHDHDGNVIVNRQFAWSSQGPTVASVGAATALATALLPGAAQITAVTESVSGTTGITVFAAAPAAGVGAALTAGNVASQFAAIPGGTFAMGATDGNNDEKPVRQVTLTTGFEMQKTEVTRAQWLAVMPLPPGNTGCDLCPVIGVTWDQAQAFITALNTALPGNNFRLPTEAQWEYAARAGSAAAFPGPIELMANYIITSDLHVWPVALRQANTFGLYDVVGNAAEWTLDWYPNPPAVYDPAQTTDPTGATSGARRVDRGGGYGSTAFTARTSYRAGAPSDQIGLRLVRN